MSGGIRTPGVERIHDPVALPAEDDLDRSLRPRRLADFVGQVGWSAELGYGTRPAEESAP